MGDLPFLKGWRVLKGGYTSIFKHLALLPNFLYWDPQNCWAWGNAWEPWINSPFSGFSAQMSHTQSSREILFLEDLARNIRICYRSRAKKTHLSVDLYIYNIDIDIIYNMWLDTRMTSNVTLIHGRISLNSISSWLPLVRSLTALGSLSTSSICKALSFSLNQFVRPSHQVVCFTQKHAVKPGISWISSMVTTNFSCSNWRSTRLRAVLRIR